LTHPPCIVYASTGASHEAKACSCEVVFREVSEEQARGRGLGADLCTGGSVKKKLSASTSSTLMFTAAGGNQEAPHTKSVFMHNKNQRNSSQRLTASTAGVFH
ncbi:hypothetical protein GOP47_0003374, partial [Adiantum capillus-veneris]